MLRIFQTPTTDRKRVALIASAETWAALDRIVETEGQTRLAATLKTRTATDRDAVERLVVSVPDSGVIMELARGH